MKGADRCSIVANYHTTIWPSGPDITSYLSVFVKRKHSWARFSNFVKYEGTKVELRMFEDTPTFPPPLLCCLFNNESTAFSNVRVKLLIRVGRGESLRGKQSPKINKESLPKEPITLAFVWVLFLQTLTRICYLK